MIHFPGNQPHPHPIAPDGTTFRLARLIAPDRKTLRLTSFGVHCLTTHVASLACVTDAPRVRSMLTEVPVNSMTSGSVHPDDSERIGSVDRLVSQPLAECRCRAASGRRRKGTA